MSVKENPVHPKGVLDKKYHINRTKKRTHSYRLRRRTEEVLKLVRKYADMEGDDFTDLIDVGTADGLMLSDIKNNVSNCRCFGLEYSMDLILANKDREVNLICGNADSLPFRDNSFNILIACAVIEHLSDAYSFIKESFRVLKRGGIIILTTPVPFWESFFSKIGHLNEDQHQETFNLKKLNKMLTANNFEVPEYKKFMISPVGFPFENFIEKILRSLRITFTFGNQIIIGKKNGN